jgi:hypothetical protein
LGTANKKHNRHKDEEMNAANAGKCQMNLVLGTKKQHLLFTLNDNNYFNYAQIIIILEFLMKTKTHKFSLNKTRNETISTDIQFFHRH